MNPIDNPFEQGIARALMAHALAAMAVTDQLDGTAEEKAAHLAGLDDVLAGRLEASGVDAETLAGAIAIVALELASRRRPAPRRRDDSAAVDGEGLVADG